MKSLILILIISLSLFGEVKIEGFKKFKLGMTLNELKSLDIVSNVNYYNPLCYVSTKHRQTLAGVDIGKSLIISFFKGRVKTISVYNINITNFKQIKNTLEKKFNNIFVFVKSKDPSKFCNYFSLKTEKEEIQLFKGCGNKSQNTMSIDIINRFNTYKDNKKINLNVNDF